MYPLKFSKVLKEKVWGGRHLETLLNIPLPPGRPFGESWEVSAHPNGPSVVELGPWKGRTLPELVTTEGASFLGADSWSRFGGRFPLLIKYLDVNDKLSIQVHPNDEYALKNEGEPGKSECWYVLYASPDARIILGTSEGTTRESFHKQAIDNRWQGLFREVAVRQGDFVHIVPGTVHASVSGSVMICEIQQNSDTTYRIYDFDRLENGVQRPLHLEKALDVIRFDQVPRVIPTSTLPAKETAQTKTTSLVRDPCYSVDLLSLHGRLEQPSADRFSVYSILSGQGTIVHKNQAWPIQAGETWFVPAGVTSRFEGALSILKAWV